MLQITDRPAALGLVIAARQASAAAITVAAGVWADRLPRHLVLVAAASVQGAVQAVAGTLVVTGHATCGCSSCSRSSSGSRTAS